MKLHLSENCIKVDLDPFNQYRVDGCWNWIVWSELREPQFNWWNSLCLTGSGEDNHWEDVFK